MERSDFLDRAAKIHGDKFDYTKSVVGGWHDKVIIICKIHGEFSLAPSNHLSNKRGCQECTKVKLRLDQAKATSKFIEEAITLRGNEFDYSKVDYINNHTKVLIMCRTHGEFLQAPDKHLMGRGCPKCRDENMSVSQRDGVNNFANKANIVHSNKYNYDKVVYGKNAHQIVEIICPEHGSFWQTPTSHLGGKGCISCSHAISKPENDWLDSLGIPQIYRRAKFKINGKLVKPDAFDPNTKTIYEFYGDFWHGNPEVYDPSDWNKLVKKSYGELYQKTLEKEALIKNAGYNLVFIWESDWVKGSNV
jgi:hypothetical protein